jgi:hypothetical protein
MRHLNYIYQMHKVLLQTKAKQLDDEKTITAK